ncbi:alpha/beta fold hydrolase [soil metagenome]
MIAWLQRFVTIAVVIAVAGGAVLFWRTGHPAWAPVGGVLVVLGYISFLALEFAVMSVVNRSDPVSTASMGQILLAWWGEVTTAPKVFCWRQPFRSSYEKDLLPSDGEKRRGVVLVHGLGCNRGMWNPWMAELRRRRNPFVAVDLEPIFGSLDDYLATVERAVSQLESITGQPPLLVGHSMGGLVIRAWFAGQRSESRVERLITIGAPHRGTWLARFGHTESARQMRIGSAWLRQLQNRDADRAAKYVCFYGHCDNIVFPASTATLRGADNRHLAATAHVQMAFHPAVFEEVCRSLNTNDRTPPPRPPQSLAALPPVDTLA